MRIPKNMKVIDAKGNEIVGATIVPRNPLPTQERLNELYEYKKKKGELVRAISTGPISPAGQIVNPKSGKTGVDGVNYPVEQIIHCLLTGEWAECYLVDPDAEPKYALSNIGVKSSEEAPVEEEEEEEEEAPKPKKGKGKGKKVVEQIDVDEDEEEEELVDEDEEEEKAAKKKAKKDKKDKKDKKKAKKG